MLIHIHSEITHTPVARFSCISLHFCASPSVPKVEGEVVPSRGSAVVWCDSARLNACSAFFALPFRRVKSLLALSVLRRFRSATVLGLRQRASSGRFEPNEEH